MKKTLLTVLCISLIATGAASCGFSNNNAVVKGDGETTTVASTQENKETIFKIGDVAQYPDMNITMNSAKISKGDDFSKPNSGNVFVGTEFTITNTSSSDVSVSSMIMFDVYVDDTLTDESISAEVLFSDKSLNGTVAAGKKLTGVFGIECPENWNTIEFHVKDSFISSNKAVFTFSKSEATEMKVTKSSDTE